jgi:hypothetical protein
MGGKKARSKHLARSEPGVPSGMLDKQAADLNEKRYQLMVKLEALEERLAKVYAEKDSVVRKFNEQIVVLSEEKAQIQIELVRSSERLHAIMDRTDYPATRRSK